MRTRSPDHPHNPIALPGTDAITIRRLGFTDTLAHVGTFVDGTVDRDVDLRLVERNRVAYAAAHATSSGGWMIRCNRNRTTRTPATAPSPRQPCSSH